MFYCKCIVYSVTFQSGDGQLAEIYRKYAEQVYAFQKEAACKAGCAYCYTHYGHLDTTTLEGLSIHSRIKKLPRPQQIKLRKNITRNKKLTL